MAAPFTYTLFYESKKLADADFKARAKAHETEASEILTRCHAVYAISPDLEKLFTEKYWKRPDPSSKGDDRQEPIYHAVGKALSNWEEADRELADLFLVLTCDQK